MRCSTLTSTVLPGETPCEGTATHMLFGSIRDEDGRQSFHDPVCKPCGESYSRRTALKPRLVPLHTHVPESNFLDVNEGHRLVQDDQHGARCFDCGMSGTTTWFKFQTNGCRCRPESITVLRYSREFLDSGLSRPEKAARMWWDYAVNFLRMGVEDWRPVKDDAKYAAFFTFRDREYGVRHDLPAGGIGAEKLPNRGRPEPEIINPDLNSYKQVVFNFHDRVRESGSEWFATWTPGHDSITDRQLIKLYTPEGAITDVLYVPGLRSWAETTGAIVDAFGSISRARVQNRIYE